jgi:uncharacterized membrane protein
MKKLLFYFLAALLVLFIIKGIFFGVWLFVVLLKYMVIAGVVAYLIYWIDKKRKKTE